MGKEVWMKIQRKVPFPNLLYDRWVTCLCFSVHPHISPRQNVTFENQVVLAACFFLLLYLNTVPHYEAPIQLLGMVL